MATHRLDQLFKKKLNKHTSAPSNDAWAKLETTLNQPSKKPIWIYRIAAAVLLLILSGVVLYNFHITETDQIADVKVEKLPFVAPIENKENLIEPKSNSNETLNTPIIEETPQRAIKSIIVIKESATMLAQDLDNRKEKEPQGVATVVVNEQLPLEDLIAMDDAKSHVENKAFKVNNVVMPAQKEEKPRPKIKIIYKRGKKIQPQAMLAENDTTSKKKFNLNKIIDATKHITSGDLIADMRDAKDDFLSRGFDFNKSNRVKNKNSNK
jgi:hypothetical protein